MGRNRYRYIKGFLALLLCAAACLGLAACGGKDSGAAAKVKDGATFTIAVAQSPDTLNPAASSGGLSAEFFLLCYDPLWRINEEGEPVPCLVEDWSLSSDKLTWTIRIRQDVTFSDGEPLTAQDVVFSYELMSRYSDLYQDYFDGISSIRCPDDYTVVITTEYVKGNMMYNPTPILPEHLWSDYEASAGDYDNAAMIGSGPFLYVPDSSGEEGWLFQSRADYFDGAAQVGAVFFSYYGTVTGAARALAAGEADASFGLTDVQLTTLESVPGVELIQALLPQAECRAIAFNTRSELLSDAAMRQLVEYCVDREWFLSMSSGGAGMTGSVFVSPGAEYFLSVSGLRSYDLSTAASLLRAAGYMDVDDDGVLEAAVTEDKLSLTLYTSSQDEWASTAATILSQDMTQLGIQVNWQKTDQPIQEVCGEKDTWDICTFDWYGTNNAAMDALRFITDIQSLTGWSSPTYESVLSQLSSVEDVEQAKSYIQQLQQLVYDECPVVVLGYGVDIQAIRDDLWTGYEDILAAAGGLFGIGSAAAYMSVAPLDSAE